MSLYDELREKHRSFIYHSYEFTEQDGNTLLRFHFSIDEYHFYPGWTLSLIHISEPTRPY